MADMVGGAAAGALFQESLQWVLETTKKWRSCSTQRGILDSTIKDSIPVVEDIKKYNNELERPREELGKLIRIMEESQELVSEASKIPWWKSYSLPAKFDKLKEKDDSITRFMSVDMQAQMARDLKENLLKVREVLEILRNQTRYENRRQLTGLCAAPGSPLFTVGLDQPLRSLKFELLQEGVSILALTGHGGSGKTTLATKLCWDDDIRGKFKENIMFVVFSKTPNLKSVVGALFQHWGVEAPEFQSDESAIIGLELLLKRMGESPKLLVLDDVWPGSESLVEKFKFQLPDYKILVTSRVAFPTFGSPCRLKPLSHEDALTLFRHFALPNDNTSNISHDMLQQVVRGCRGSPLALKVVGRSLRGKPIELWQKMLKEWSRGHSILDSSDELLTHLQNSLNMLLDDKLHTKECFMDLALFPEDQRVPVAALIDMWVQLYDLDEDAVEVMARIYELTTRNLANLVVTKETASDGDNNYKVYNNHFLEQHDLLRELAIHQSSQESFQQRERLVLEINKNRPEWWPQHRQQWLVSRMLSLSGIQQERQQVAARTISISTDEMFIPDWCNLRAAEAEVLVLNLRTKKYTLPECMASMKKLKVLVVTNYGFHPSELNNFQILNSLSKIEKIRLEKVLVPFLGKLKDLKKLSLYMCNTSEAFKTYSIPISDALPNLVELNIDYCKDLLEFPAKLCDITPLKKISISNCHKLSVLPQEIGKLENLELLRLSSCTNLEELPESIGRLHNLRFLDVSNCYSLSRLPEGIGNLKNLEKVNMMDCSRCELPKSVLNLEVPIWKCLKGVICDEETAASWEPFQRMLPQLRIVVPKVDINLNWLSVA